MAESTEYGGDRAQVRGRVEGKAGLFVGQHRGQSDQSGQEIKRNNGI